VNCIIALDISQRSACTCADYGAEKSATTHCPIAPTTRVHVAMFPAGIRNLKLNAVMHIEVCEPIETPPFCAAITMAFLEPLAPEFQLQLSNFLVPGAVAEGIAKPTIMRILKDAVFSVRGPGRALWLGPSSAARRNSGRLHEQLMHSMRSSRPSENRTQDTG
jgi:hypothetical protein